MDLIILYGGVAGGIVSGLLIGWIVDRRNKKLRRSKKENAIDILQKIAFFQGTRAGRELWFDKSIKLQEEDLENFNKDIESVMRYVMLSK